MVIILRGWGRLFPVDLEWGIRIFGYPLFDGKPVVVRPWSPEISLVKEAVKTVPTWVRLHQLELKFWGERCLHKIASLVGEPVKIDAATTLKHRLGFARIMVEVALSEKCVDSIQFLDELGYCHEVMVEFEWKHVLCAKCKSYGHGQEDCRKGVVRPPQVWRHVQRVQPIVEQRQAPIVEEAPIAQSVPVVNEASVHQVDSGPLVPSMMGTLVTFREILSSALNRSVNALDLAPVGVMDKLYFWNVRGLNSLAKQKELKSFLHLNKIGLVGVLETNFCNMNFNKVAASFEKEWEIRNNNQFCDLGRIWTMWRSGCFTVQVLSVNSQFMHCECSLVSSAWIVAGDFNNVFFPNERIGAPVRLPELLPFQRCVNACGLFDLKTIGKFFTWTNKQDGGDKVLCKLDRGLVNDAWMVDFPNSFADFRPEGLFDHSPCVVQLDVDGYGRRSPFKFLNMWVKDEIFSTIARRLWQEYIQGVAMFHVITKLKRLKGDFRLLNKRDPHDQMLGTLEKQASITCKELEHNRWSFLQQKTKVDWIRSADANIIVVWIPG
ncbi:hypothetical protein RND81_01G075200 [Saponaria officinalis]|uniref:DUF4283 domain-containing protein n=1 Tax=Saponaria officinalis TaxID=3572 RepID=A0AAW1NH67_SAPOF